MPLDEPLPNIVNVSEGTELFHITDLEGRCDLLQREIDNFNVGKAAEDQKIKIIIGEDGKERLEIPKNVIFVHGGDASDKGASDLRIRRLFINTKDHYIAQEDPQRIILIGGNRDYINVRYHKELPIPRIYDTLMENKKPEWIKAENRVTFAHLVLRKILEQEPVPDNFRLYMEQYGQAADKNNTIRELLKDNNILDGIRQYLIDKYKDNDTELQFLYLQWMHDATMGRVGTIEYRREELQIERWLALPENSRKIRGTMSQIDFEAAKKIVITNAEILASFQEEEQLRKYLEYTQIAVKIGNSENGYVMVSHSGMAPEGLKLGETTYASIDAWIKAVNAVPLTDINTIYTNDYTVAANPDKGGFYSELERLSLPDGITGQQGDSRRGTPISFECWQKQKIVLSNGVEITQVVPHLDSDIVAKMQQGKIYALATGHKPTGDSELGTVYTMRTEAGVFLLCTTDITFGKDAKEHCAAVYHFTADGIETTMTSHSAKLDANIIVALPIVGTNTREKLDADDLYVGKIFYCPDFSLSIAQIKAYDPNAIHQPEYFAWNVMLVEKKDDRTINKIILQRMDNFSAVQVALDATKAGDKEKIAAIMSYTGIAPVLSATSQPIFSMLSHRDSHAAP